MSNKKSLYEILEVATDASYPEIRAAHDRLLRDLESRQSALSHEDYNLQLRLLKVAYSTLSTPTSRDAYDAHLFIRNEAAKPLSVALVATPPAGQAAAAVRAEALLIRADAMALRADAMGLKADLVSGWSEPAPGLRANPLVARLLSSSKTVLMTLGTIVAIGMVFKVAFMVTRNVQSDQPVSGHSQKEDKLFLQEYYQTWGVRPASRAEAELMDAERRSSEEAKRAQREADEARRRTAQDEHRFEVDAHRRAEQVSAETDSAERRARQAALEDDRQKEHEKNMKIEAERQRVETERARVEAEHARWQRVLGTSGSNN